MSLSLLTNVAVCALLIAAIAVAVNLTRKLAALRAAQGELAAMGEAFAKATAKAEAGLAALRETATGDAGALQDGVTRAQGLKDDLEFLIERAESAADRLEGAIGEARGVQGGQIGRPVPVARPVESPRAAEISIGDTIVDEPSASVTLEAGEPPAHVSARADKRGLPPAGRDLLRALQGMR